MKIKRIHFDDRAIVILGAGATRGASFTNNQSGSLPPLDSDFFTQAQRLTGLQPQRLLYQLISDVVNTFGSNFNLTMEGYLTRLEQLANVYQNYRKPGRPSQNPYQKMRGNFLQLLAALLNESVGRAPDCVYHRALIESLTYRDSILSFNYDWLVDSTLKKYGHGNWNPAIGYGVKAHKRGKLGAGTSFWAQHDINDNPIWPNYSITLLKMHGSMNWFPMPDSSGSKHLRLRERWWHQQGDLRFEIAPPEWNKRLHSELYKIIWRKARDSISNTRAIVIVGYSLPYTDLPAQALLMVDKSAPKLKLLVTVNPDDSSRKRIRQALVHRINDKTRVLSFNYFNEFADFLRI